MAVVRHVRIHVRGIVQGVGFRPFVYRTAVGLGLTGGVRNLGDAGVEIEVQGPGERVEEFIGAMQGDPPPLAEVDRITVEDLPPNPTSAEFVILPSLRGKGASAGTIPPDTAICEACLADVRDEASHYNGYWATSCVDCGPRYTVIVGLPYDRPLTSMEEFPMCESCQRDYTDPLDRRHHAQTVACSRCGPQLSLVDSEGGDPILETVRALREGEVVAIKGIGGCHIACDASREDLVTKLRERFGRPSKPFALLARDVDMVRRFAELGPEEERLLTSIRRPILVLYKRDPFPLSNALSPGLPNVAVMLPYTGLHHLLYDHLDFPLVMTSANLPGRPMLIENTAILKGLEDVVDRFLLHNRRIVARCDDSLVRFTADVPRFIRRSRGWAPTPLKLPANDGPDVLALGAEYTNAIVLHHEGNCYQSQFLGDVDDVETYDFLRETVDHLLGVTGLDMPTVVACDLHPDFLTTRLAQDMVSEGRDLIRVQHHHAHIASVLGERQEETAIGIAVDGLGYGEDSTVWGGEILLAELSRFTRVAGLSTMRMPGGDRAARYPARMVAGILYGEEGAEDVVGRHVRFLGGEQERRIVFRQLEAGINTPAATSTGRFLDGVSALLGVCHERRYEGEPAMRLEGAAWKGEDLGPDLVFGREGDRRVLDVRALFRDLVSYVEKGHRAKDVAMTAQMGIARGLATLAVEEAERRKLGAVALSGGVAYNGAIAARVKAMVEGAGLAFWSNERVPCGDGGIAFGQTVVALARQS